MRWRPWCSQSEGGPLAHAMGASVVPKRRRPPRPCVGGLGGPKAKEAPSPMQWGPWWSQSEGGPLAHAVVAWVVPKRRRPPRPCGAGLGGSKAKEAPSPTRRGPRWSQSEGGPLAVAAGAAMTPKRWRPPRPCSGGTGGPKAEEAPTPMRLGPRRPKAKEAPSPMRWGPRWSQSVVRARGQGVETKRRAAAMMLSRTGWDRTPLSVWAKPVRVGGHHGDLPSVRPTGGSPPPPAPDYGLHGVLRATTCCI